MTTLKPKSAPVDCSRPNSGRRSFIRKTGAALSAVVASAAAGFPRAAPGSDAGLNDRIGRLSRRVGNLEDAEKVRRLHRAYESSLDRGLYEEVVAMFAGDAEVIYNGGLFRGTEGVRRLYCGNFSPGRTGKRIEPAPGFEPDPAQPQESIEVAEDGRTATGRFAYSIQVGTPMKGNSSLIAMARLQGEGIAKCWEGGTCEATYVKAGDSWKIRRLEYHATAQADYRPGRTHSSPIEVQAFKSVFPGDPTGPDKLVC